MHLKILEVSNQSLVSRKLSPIVVEVEGGGVRGGRGRGMRGGGVGGYEPPPPEPEPEPETPPPFGAGEECCRSEYDYESQAEGELSFGVGVVIVIKKRDESGWWQGMLEDGTMGWFPANFVVEIESPQAVYVPPPPTAMEIFDQVVPNTEKIKVPSRAKRPGKRLPSRDKRKLGATVATKEDTEDKEPATKIEKEEEPIMRTGRSQTIASRGAPPPMVGANQKTLTKRSSFGPNQLKAVSKAPEKTLTQSESLAEPSFQDRLKKRREAAEELSHSSEAATTHDEPANANLNVSLDSSVFRGGVGRGRGRGRGAVHAMGDAAHEEVSPHEPAMVAVVEAKMNEEREKAEEAHDDHAPNKFRGRGGLVRGRGGRPPVAQETEAAHEAEATKPEPAKVESHRPAPTPSIDSHRPAPSPPSSVAAAPAPAPAPAPAAVAPTPSPAAPAPVVLAASEEESSSQEKEPEGGVQRGRGRGAFGRGGLRRGGGEALSTSGSEKSVTSPLISSGGEKNVVAEASPPSPSPVRAAGPSIPTVNERLVGALTALCQKAFSARGQGAPNHRISQFVQKSGNSGSFSFAVCTVDGGVWEYGDKGDFFTLQDCIYPFIYSFLLETKNSQAVDLLVGESPVAMSSLMMSLNDKSKPHNALMASGAMVLSNSLYSDKGSPGQRLRAFLEKLSDVGGSRYTCDLPTYISCNISGDQHYALAYWLKGASPAMREADPPKVLDFFFQLKSVEATCGTLAALAAVLANNGVRPGGGERVLREDVASRTVGLMKACGMRAGSAEWTRKNG